MGGCAWGLYAPNAVVVGATTTADTMGVTTARENNHCFICQYPPYKSDYYRNNTSIR